MGRLPSITHNPQFHFFLILFTLGYQPPVCRHTCRSHIAANLIPRMGFHVSFQEPCEIPGPCISLDQKVTRYNSQQVHVKFHIVPGRSMHNRFTVVHAGPLPLPTPNGHPLPFCADQPRWEEGYSPHVPTGMPQDIHYSFGCKSSLSLGYQSNNPNCTR